MKSYLAYLKVTLRLTLRDRGALFFNYLFPLLFFFIFAQAFHAERGGAVTQVLSMVFILGVLGNGLFGAGIRAVQEREAGILRRFKVTPISPLPILIASMVTGWLVFLPSVVLFLGLSHLLYGMGMPERWLSLLVFLSIGIATFRAMGMIVAAVVNSMQENQIVIQLLYMPMLFLSGATFPVEIMPTWLQVVAQFLPASYLYSGVQGILFHGENLAANAIPAAALLLAMGVGTFVSAKLFRWEKEEKIRPAAKAWVLAVLMPFFLLGAYQAYSRDNVRKTRTLARDLRRSRTVLLRNARIFTGRKVIETGAVLVKDGRSAEGLEGQIEETARFKADVIEAAGKTVLPALMDIDARLGREATISDKPSGPAVDRVILRHVAADLYCGVATVNSVGDAPELLLKAAARLSGGDWNGAEMVQARTAPAPELGAIEAQEDLEAGRREALDRTLVGQVLPPRAIDFTRRTLARRIEKRPERAALQRAQEELRRAWQGGALPALGTGAGKPLVFHGPAVHRELQLWVEAGIPPQAALEAATSNAARALGVAERVGRVAKGMEASLLVVDVNPLQDIAATERISMVFFKGERVYRSELLEQK